MTPAQVRAAVAQARTLPHASANPEDALAWNSLMLEGKTGSYYLGDRSDKGQRQGAGWFSTPYSRVVAAAYEDMEHGLAVKPPSPRLIRQELHIYVSPGETLSSAGGSLIVGFIRRPESSNPGANIYPLRVEPLSERESESMDPNMVFPTVRLVFSLDALVDRNEVVTVWSGWATSCNGPVCVSSLRTEGVK